MKTKANTKTKPEPVWYHMAIITDKRHYGGRFVDGLLYIDGKLIGRVKDWPVPFLILSNEPNSVSWWDNRKMEDIKVEKCKSKIEDDILIENMIIFDRALMQDEINVLNKERK